MWFGISNNNAFLAIRCPQMANWNIFLEMEYGGEHFLTNSLPKILTTRWLFLFFSQFHDSYGIKYGIWDLFSWVNDLPAVRAHLFLTWTPVPQVTEHSPNSDQDPQVPSWNEQFVIHSYFMQNEQGTGSKLVLNMGHSWHISFFVYVFSPTT